MIHEDNHVKIFHSAAKIYIEPCETHYFIVVSVAKVKCKNTILSFVTRGREEIRNTRNVKIRMEAQSRRKTAKSLKMKQKIQRLLLKHQKSWEGKCKLTSCCN